MVLGLAEGRGTRPSPGRSPASAAPPAPPVRRLAGGGAAVLVPQDRLVFLVQLEVGGGGVEEQQVDLEVQGGRDLAEDLLLQGPADLGAASPSPGSTRRRSWPAARRYGPCGRPSARRRAWRTGPAPGWRPARTAPARWPRRGGSRSAARSWPGRSPAAATAGPAGRSRRRRPTRHRPAPGRPRPQPGRWPSRRPSDPASRSTAARSSWSSRPKLCTTRIRDDFVAGSHSFCDQLHVADGAAVLVPPRRSAHEHVTTINRSILREDL